MPHAGRVSREQANAKAENEYDRFTARRRAQIEATAETDLLHTLEESVKKLPKIRKKSKKDKEK